MPKLKIVASYWPQKDDPYRIRFTVGGDKLIDYAGPCSAPTAEIQTAKCLFNSVISTKGTRFSVLDLKNLYHSTPLPRYKYMWIPGEERLCTSRHHSRPLPPCHQDNRLIPRCR